jgi:hypothetical protein
MHMYFKIRIQEKFRFNPVLGYLFPNSNAFMLKLTFFRKKHVDMNTK